MSDPRGCIAILFVIGGLVVVILLIPVAIGILESGWGAWVFYGILGLWFLRFIIKGITGG